MRKAKILGHRGARAEVLENTKAGFSHAHKLASIGLAGIEFDAQLTADNRLILTHDNKLDRLCKQQGRIEQLSAAYCKKVFNQHTKHELLELIDVVPFLLDFRYVEFELKTHKRMSNRRFVEVLATQFFALDMHKMPIVLTSFDTDLLRLLQHHKTLSKIPRGLLIEDNLHPVDIIDTALRLQCAGIGVHHKLITPKLIDLTKRYDLNSTAWTVNEACDAMRLISWGVDNIITDHPTHFLQEILS